MSLSSSAGDLPQTSRQAEDVSCSLYVKGLERRPGRTLDVVAFNAHEAIFAPMRVEIEIVSADDAIALEELMDRPATLTVSHKYQDEPRHFSGVVVEAERGDTGQRRTAYRLVLMSALARLGHGSDCRIFQMKSVPEIVSEIFKEHEIDHAEWMLGAPHEAREFCVQYRETHLAFIARLLAEEGIWYHLTSGPEGQETLVLTDSPGAPDCPQQPKLAYNGMASGVLKDVWCYSFSRSERLRATSLSLNDYTFKNPDARQLQRHVCSHGNGVRDAYHLYDYPGRYKQDGPGKAFTRTRLEAARVDATTAAGASNGPHLVAGRRFELTDHPGDGVNGRYRLLAVVHRGEQGQAALEDAAGPEAPGAAVQTAYEARFIAQPADLVYRPPMQAKPMVDGPQIAIVTGPEGEDIHTDEHGRVKLWFPWDRHTERCEHSSCWVRVAQGSAGPGFGSLAIPRIGQEVIVDFLEGDPDQPIVTGRAYHATNRAPYALPANKTKMVIRSCTHKAADKRQQYNELSFEDEAGSEEILLRAQRDKLEMVPNRSYEIVGSGFDGLLAAIGGAIGLGGFAPGMQGGLTAMLDHAGDAPDERYKYRG